MRIAVISLVPIALSLACSCIAVEALAGSMQSMAFSFADDGGVAYRYVGGDLPFEATAELTGRLILEYDTDSGDASIILIEGSLHSPQQIVGGGLEGADWLEGADLEVEAPGIFDGMTGVRTGPLEFLFTSMNAPYRFGSYRTEFLLSLDPADFRLSGKAEFNGADGPTMYLDAPLVAVPEPACLVLSTILGVVSLDRVRRRGKW